MLVKVPLPFVGWLRRRREQRAMLMATDELSHSRDDILSDIGISREDIIKCALHDRGERLER